MKRILSMVLTLGLVMTLAAVPASAAGTASIGNFDEKQTYAEGQFTDVKAADWYSEGVAKMFALGLMNGTSGNTFSPDKAITATEIYLLMARLENIYAGGSGELVGDDWQTRGKDYLDGKGLAIDLHAAQDGTVARAYVMGQLVKVLPASEFAAINTIEKLPDVDANTPYSAEILTLYNAGVLTGGDKYGTFAPDKAISRGELATLLVRVIEPTSRKSFTLDKYIPSVEIGYGVTPTLFLDGRSNIGRPYWEKMPHLVAALENVESYDYEKALPNLRVTTKSTEYGAGAECNLFVVPTYSVDETALEGIKFSGVEANDDGGLQYAAIEGLLKDTINAADTASIMKVLNEMADKVNVGRNEKTGSTTEESQKWEKSQVGKKYEFNEVIFQWAKDQDYLKSFTITTKPQ